VSSFEEFAALHVPGDPFLLVNAWDVCSALALADAGHSAVGTTSLGVNAAAGLIDGARRGREVAVELARRLQGRLSVPLTVDLEDGYSGDPAAVGDLVAVLTSAGVAGVNIEDGGRSGAEHQAVLAAVRARNDRVFINARTDEFWSGGHDIVAVLERCRAYRDAGAHGLFVPGLTDPGQIDEVAALGLPLNVLWQPGVDLHATRAARISTGSALYRAALGAALSTAQSARADTVPPPAVAYSATQQLLGLSSVGERTRGDGGSG
jgi:2-methylisocitrate lyase-like PEP mutase family enzyme